jgi:hypothetical protein
VNQAPLALAFLLGFIGLLTFFTVRVRAGQKPALRRIRAFDTLKGLMARAVESGRGLHVSLGIGSMANQSTADSLAGLSALNFLSEQAAETGTPPIVSMSDPTVMLFAQNVVRTTHADSLAGVEEAVRQIRWIAPQPAAYVAGVMNILDSEEVDGTVMVGKFGDEYLLMGETAARHGMAHIGGTSDPNTLPFIYASAQETLLGEEIYAAGAYLENNPAHVASLVAQDGIRWVIALIIIGGVLVATLNWNWLWILIAMLIVAFLASIVVSSLR